MQIKATFILILEILYLLTVISIVVVVISENRNPIKTVRGCGSGLLPFIGSSGIPCLARIQQKASHLQKDVQQAEKTSAG